MNGSPIPPTDRARLAQVIAADFDSTGITLLVWLPTVGQGAAIAFDWTEEIEEIKGELGIRIPEDRTDVWCWIELPTEVDRARYVGVYEHPLGFTPQSLYDRSQSVPVGTDSQEGGVSE
jgi:hypothetical protein